MWTHTVIGQRTVISPETGPFRKHAALITTQWPRAPAECLLMTTLLTYTRRYSSRPSHGRSNSSSHYSSCSSPCSRHCCRQPSALRQAVTSTGATPCSQCCNVAFSVIILYSFQTVAERETRYRFVLHHPIVNGYSDTSKWLTCKRYTRCVLFIVVFLLLLSLRLSKVSRPTKHIGDDFYRSAISPVLDTSESTRVCVCL